MTYRTIKSVVVVIICWLVVNHLEDAARWLRMRDMSNPNRYQPAPRRGANA